MHPSSTSPDLQTNTLRKTGDQTTPSAPFKVGRPVGAALQLQPSQAPPHSQPSPAITAPPTSAPRGARRTAPSLSPEVQARILDVVKATPDIRCGLVAQALGVSGAQAISWLAQMVELGLLVQTNPSNKRAWYRIVDHGPHPELFRADLSAPILRQLSESPAMASGLSVLLREPVEQVRETCRQLAADGLLRIRRVGQGLIYSTDPDTRISWLQPGQTVPESSETRLQRSLGALQAGS